MVEDKVVPFQQNPGTRVISPSAARQLGDACRKLTLSYLKDLLQQMFDTADDTLFKLAESSTGDNDQTLYFDSMRIIRFKRDDIEEAFFNEVSDAFREFWISTPHEESGEFVFSDELSLVDEQDLEEELAINNLIKKIRSNFQQEISAIEKRLSSIVTNKSIDSSNNPIGPETFCKAFQFAAQALNTDIKIKLILFKLFDFHISKNIGEHYHKINELFIEAGVLPELKLKVRNQNRTPPTAPNSNPLSQADTTVNVSHNPAQAGLLGLFQQVRLSPGSAPTGQQTTSVGTGLSHAPGNTGALTGNVMTTETVISNLTPLQVQNLDNMAGDTVETISQHIKQAISSSHPGQSISPVDNDTIDLVSMLFEFVLDDEHVPAKARSSIARLQIPIIKAAILDKEFFNIGGHPARKLLNSLAHAALNLPNEEIQIDPPALLAIQHAVNRILHEFKNDLSIFTDVLNTFEQALDNIQQQNQSQEQESLEPFYKKEEYHLANQWVTETIQAQIDGKDLPAPFISLLLGAWKNVMVDTFLEQGQQSQQWKSQQRFIDILCWSIEPKFVSQDRKKLGNILSFIINTLKEGLIQIDTPQDSIDRIVKALEPYHYASLHGKPAIDDDDFVDSVFPTNDKTDALTDSIEQLQEAIDDLPDIDLFEFNEPDTDKEIMENIVLESFDFEQDAENYPDDEYLELARHLEAGKWVEFIDKDQHKTRARLAWKSDLLGEFTFLNWKFDVIADKKLFELANDFRIGKAKVIDDLPLIDRAFSAIMNTLQGKTASAN